MTLMNVVVPQVGKIVIYFMHRLVCTSGLSQLVAREYLKACRLSTPLERIQQLYGMKRKAMLSALAEYFDPSWNVSWTRPDGGLFLWLTLPRWMNAGTLLKKALERDIAFMVGQAFHFDGSGESTLRLNFSYPDIRQIDTAIARLAGCTGAMVRERRRDRESTPGSHVLHAAC